MMTKTTFHKINLEYINESEFKHRGVGCLIVSKDNQIILQVHDAKEPGKACRLSTFGGSIADDADPLEALAKKLHNKLGAKIIADEVVDLGVVTSSVMKKNMLIHMYFWHDKDGSITKKDDNKAMYLDAPIQVDENIKISSRALWILNECKKRQLI